ncbi:MAG: hypothetical protein HZC36_00735 [Armatimonadetes bacterium]|nr:hypothetical protein [Armatimonadota bacterium]
MDDEVEQRLQKAVDRIEKELDVTFGTRLGEMEEAAERTRNAPDLGIDPDLERRLSRIESQAKDARARNENVGSIPKRRSAKDAEDYRGLGVGLSIAYTIIGFPVLFAVVGLFVDRANGTSQWAGIGAIAGAALGMGMALFMLKRNEER